MNDNRISFMKAEDDVQRPKEKRYIHHIRYIREEKDRTQVQGYGLLNGQNKMRQPAPVDTSTDNDHVWIVQISNV
jgi:hypothetical protein